MNDIDIAKEKSVDQLFHEAYEGKLICEECGKELDELSELECVEDVVTLENHYYCEECFNNWEI